MIKNNKIAIKTIAILFKKNVMNLKKYLRNCIEKKKTFQSLSK